MNWLKYAMVMFTVAIIGLYGAIYCFGYDLARFYVNGDTPTHIINDETPG